MLLIHNFGEFQEILFQLIKSSRQTKIKNFNDVFHLIQNTIRTYDDELFVGFREYPDDHSGFHGFPYPGLERDDDEGDLGSG